MGRNMVIGRFSTALTLLNTCLLGVVSCRGIGTRVSPPVTQPAVGTTAKDVDDLMYSWIIPRLISMKYAQPYKQIGSQAEEPLEEETVEPLVNENWYTHPNLRGKRVSTFFPFPASFMEKFTKAREARSSPVTMEKVQEVVLPWEMKYFSPMLRG